LNNRHACVHFTVLAYPLLDVPAIVVIVRVGHWIDDAEKGDDHILFETWDEQIFGS